MILCAKCNKPILDTYVSTTTVPMGYTKRLGTCSEYYHIGHAPNSSKIVSMSSVVRVLANLESPAKDMLQKDRKGLTNTRHHRAYSRRY